MNENKDRQLAVTVITPGGRVGVRTKEGGLKMKRNGHKMLRAHPTIREGALPLDRGF